MEPREKGRSGQYCTLMLLVYIRISAIGVLPSNRRLYWSLYRLRISAALVTLFDRVDVVSAYAVRFLRRSALTLASEDPNTSAAVG